MTSGAQGFVVDWTPWRLNSGSSMASMAAMTAGVISGVHPAMAQLMATCSYGSDTFLGVNDADDVFMVAFQVIYDCADPFFRWRAHR